MAKANTLQWEGGGYQLHPNTEEFENGQCYVCGKDKGRCYRLFYYPTFMNGDAESEASLCEEHAKDKALKNKLYQEAKARLKL